VGAAVTRYSKLIAALIAAAATVVTGMGSHGSWETIIPAALGAFSVWYLPNQQAKS